MILRELFPLFYNSATQKDYEQWNAIFSFDQKSCEILHDIWADEMSLVSDYYGQEINLTSNLCQDILNLHESNSQHEDILWFLQFQFATGLCMRLGGKKLFTELFQWIANSMSNSIRFDVLKEFNPGRILIFEMSSHTYIKLCYNRVFAEWTCMLFYQQRVKGSFFSLVKFYVKHLFDKMELFASPIYYDDIIILAFCQIQTWASNVGNQELKDKCSHALLWFYSRPWMQSSGGKIVAMQFCSVGYQYTDASKQEWYERVQRMFTLDASERLQLLCSVYKDDSVAIISHLDEILLSIRGYNQMVDNLIKNDIHRDFEVSRVFSIIQGVMPCLGSSTKKWRFQLQCETTFCVRHLSD